MPARLLVLIGTWLIAALPVAAKTTGLRPTIRAERIQLKESIQETRQEFRQRLTQIRDARKKAIAERINARMCEVIKNRAAAMGRHLQTMTNILTRVEEKAAAQKANGVNVSTVEAAVSAAKAAIAAAQSAVDALATAQCGLAISGQDDQLGTEVSQNLKQLRDQIKSVHNQVQAARKATSSAVQALAKILGEPVPSPVAQ